MKKTILIAFILTILVGIAVAATITVSWDKPTTWSDGSPLTTIVGYNVYYGNAHNGPYPNKVSVLNVTSATLLSIPTGTWYIVSTALATNATGSVVESAYSNEVMKVIDERKPNAPTNETIVSVVLA